MDTEYLYGPVRIFEVQSQYALPAVNLVVSDKLFEFSFLPMLILPEGNFHTERKGEEGQIP